jgi:UDP-N-acetylglucosamine acyltransferase
MMIHQTAIVDPGAEIDADVEIGPYSIIREHVHIGSGTEIGPHVVIEPFVNIESDCHIFQYAALGGIPQSTKFKGEETHVKIGRGTVIREFVTINRGTGFGGGITEVGEEGYLMAYSHMGHDCKIGRNVTLTNNVTLAGHVTMGDYAMAGGLAAIHQFVRIGDHVMVGGRAAVVKDVPPYVLVVGDRAKLHGLNNVGLRRHEFSQETISLLKKTYKIIFRTKLTLNKAIERVNAEIDQIPEVTNFINFLKASERGITR